MALRTAKINRHKILTALLIIILIVAGYFVYEKVAYEMNKHAFAEAKSAIDTVYADIVSKVGPPDDKKTINDCSAVREVYGDGPLFCSLDSYFIYQTGSKSATNVLRAKIQEVVNQDSKFLKPVQAPPTNSQVNTSSGSDSQPVINYFRAKGGVYCTLDYIFDPTFNTELVLKSPNTDSLYIHISCFGHARGIFY